ncbi:MAG TPA: IgGFc-binding protein [Kofleriaceae bacterium]|nr:IgGFc-binding protein [Kofleriaceae bacterium]
MRWTYGFIVLAFACGPSARDHGSDDTGGECTPAGAHRCTGRTYESCVDGAWTQEAECPNGCAEGLGCVDACTEAAATHSYMGCEYWAVDLDNAVEVLGSATQGLTCAQMYGIGKPTMQKVCAIGNGIAGLCDPPNDGCPMSYTCSQKMVCTLDAQHSPFSIVVSNPQTTDVEVTVVAMNNTMVTKTVQAGQVLAIMPQQEGIADQSVDGTGKMQAAYKITSTLPIIAYQFNPLDNVDVFSNDASLLIPRTAFDSDYLAMSWPTLERRNGIPSQHDYHGYLTVVAWENGTEIEVTPSADVQASATQPALTAGTPTLFTLGAFDTLNLEALGAGDLTGTRVRATSGATVGLFVGHEAAGFGEDAPPDSHNTRGPCCADHLEEMALPTSTWGKSYTIARSEMRTNENDVIRILARNANTTVTFMPEPTSTMSGDCSHLDAGQYCTVRIMHDTAVEASEPVMVGHYLESAIWNGGGNGVPPTTVGNGDPSMSIAVPVEQYRTDYTILVPSSYQQNFLSISTGATGTVTVDGSPLMLDAAVGFRAARTPVAAGQHTIKCPERCGVEVYGYSDAVSYMFAGGLDLRPIVLSTH